MKHTMMAPVQGVSRAVLALALAGSCAFAAAEATSETPAEDAVLAPVTVSAHGVSVPYDRTGVCVSVLDTDTLRDKQGITTLSDALTTVPGVFALPGGGSNQHGNVSNIAIRGISGNTATLTMMDGMRLFETTGGMNSTPNVIGRTTLFGLGNAEVLRGAQGAIYGGGAMGGVIWMETPEGTADKPALTLFNEYGSFDSYTGNVTAQGRQGKLAYYVSGTYEHTNNDLRHADGSSPAVKHAGRYTNAAEAVRLDYHANEDNTLTFTYRREDATYHRAFPYVLYSPTYDPIGQDTAAPTYDFRSQLVTLKGQSRLNKHVTTSLLVGYYGSDSDFGYDASAGNEVRYNLRNVQADWRNVITWNERHSTTAGIGWTRSDYASRTTSKGSTYSSADDTLENIYAFYAEHRYSPVKNWDNTLALRVDESTTFNTLTTARAASTYRFNRERTRVFASAGRGYRAPGSFQRAAGTRNTAWGLYQGNPNLRCETSRSADIGIEQAVGENHSATATLFVARTDKAIYTYTDFNTYPYPYTFANSTGHWTSQGIELTLQGTWEKAWNTGYTVAYTYTQPKRQDNYKDKAIPYSTRQMWNADIHTSPLPGLTTGIGLTAAAQRMDYGLNRVDDFCTLRWYARYEVNEHLSLHLRVENLTDEKFVSEFSYHDPAWSVLNPGVGVYGGCTLSF